MPLSCECDYDDPDFYWWQPSDYSEMPERKRRKRCNSCFSFLEAGSIVAEFSVTRDSRCDYEFSRFGEGDPGAISLAPVYLCECCADLFFSLDELGFCVSPYEAQRELVREYAQMNQPNAWDRGSI